MTTQLTFIVSTNLRNYPFILPFAYFAAKYNSNCAIDVHLYPDCDMTIIQNGIKFLQHKFNCKLNVSIVSSTNITPQLYRFLVEPIDNTEYAYCCDSDIMICEDILPFHIAKLNGNDFCYDNEIRYYSDSSKMSGLHFCTHEWYVKTINQRHSYLNQSILTNTGSTNCERILKDIAEKSNILLHPATKDINDFMLKRPIHGQHISLSRQPFNKNCKMKDELNDQYKHEFICTIKEDHFKELMHLCCNETVKIFNTYLDFVGIKERF